AAIRSPTRFGGFYSPASGSAFLRRLLPAQFVQSQQTQDALVIATASGLRGLANLPIRRIRGQVTEVRATPASRNWRQPECHHGYLIPAVDGLHCVGATFNLRDTAEAARAADDAANLEQLRGTLPERWNALGGTAIEVVGQRVGFRCQARDYLPIAGPAESGPNASGRVWLNLAHGSRGITGTPLTADLLADRLSRLPAAVDSAIEKALSPERFAQT
ncbi:MAG: FAD-dependent oxidoreductase, partial [Wenzhouxiangellaceae bacterium]